MNWLKKVMIGRYGVDQLSMFLIGVSITLSVTSLILRGNQIIGYITMLTILVAYFRIFSKNISKRYQENQMFLTKWNPLKRKFMSITSKIKDMKNYKFYKCPSCNQTLRVPKGKGRISITCPKCKTAIIRRT